MYSRLIVALVAGMFTATIAPAGDISYNFLRLDYLNTEVDVGPFDVEGDGPELQGSLEVSDMFHLFAGYQSIDFDFGVDGTAYEVGGGYRHSFTPATDFIGTLSYIDVELESSGGDFDDSGLGLSAGIRHLFHDRFEMLGRLNYVDLDDSTTSVEFRGDYFLTDQWALGGGLELGDDTTTWLIGGRYNFAGFLD